MHVSAIVLSIALYPLQISDQIPPQHSCPMPHPWQWLFWVDSCSGGLCSQAAAFSFQASLRSPTALQAGVGESFLSPVVTAPFERWGVCSYLSRKNHTTVWFGEPSQSWVACPLCRSFLFLSCDTNTLSVSDCQPYPTLCRKPDSQTPTMLVASQLSWFSVPQAILWCKAEHEPNPSIKYPPHIWKLWGEIHSNNHPSMASLERHSRSGSRWTVMIWAKPLNAVVGDYESVSGFCFLYWGRGHTI